MPQVGPCAINTALSPSWPLLQEGGSAGRQETIFQDLVCQTIKLQISTLPPATSANLSWCNRAGSFLLWLEAAIWGGFQVELGGAAERKALCSEVLRIWSLLPGRGVKGLFFGCLHCSSESFVGL